MLQLYHSRHCASAGRPAGTSAYGVAVCANTTPPSLSGFPPGCRGLAVWVGHPCLEWRLPVGQLSLSQPSLNPKRNRSVANCTCRGTTSHARPQQYVGTETGEAQLCRQSSHTQTLSALESAPGEQPELNSRVPDATGAGFTTSWDTHVTFRLTKTPRSMPAAEVA